MEEITVDEMHKSIEERLGELGEHFQFIMEFMTDAASLCLSRINAVIEEKDLANMNGLIYTQNMLNAHTNLMHAMQDYFDSFSAYAKMSEEELAPAKNIKNTLSRLYMESSHKRLVFLSSQKQKELKDVKRFIDDYTNMLEKYLKNPKDIQVEELMRETTKFLSIKNYMYSSRDINSYLNPLTKFEQGEEE